MRTAEGVGYQECLVKNAQYFSRFILNSQFKKVFPIALGSCGFVAQNMSFSTVVRYKPLRILLSMFLFFLFLARERGRNGERPQTLY